MIIESTGGHVLFINPIMRYNIAPNWSLLLSGDIPIYKNVNGYQLTNQFGLQIGIGISL